MVEGHNTDGTFKQGIHVLDNVGLGGAVFIQMGTGYAFGTTRCAGSVEHDGNGIIRDGRHRLETFSMTAESGIGIRSGGRTNGKGPGRILRLLESGFDCRTIRFLVHHEAGVCIGDTVGKLTRWHAEIDGCIDEAEQLACPVDDQVFAAILQDH